MQNPRLHLAEEFVLYTRKNLFLTGRAGTGKTTFLKNVLTSTTKNYMVVAPTGVAAINAGGTTIHSLFQFPLTAFTPDGQTVDFNIATNRPGLAKHIRYRADKAKLFRALELLVIDEISMVRADLLDAIDFALRRVRGVDHPFGNVQLLVIGDLFQLAPVVKAHVWDVLRNFYESPYFFDSRSWKQSQPITIELTKIYRQKNQEFIDILNRMRYGQSSEADVNRLNQNYQPDFKSNAEKYITLTTHNYKADKINADEMNSLSAKAFKYKAEIDGQFNENAYPADPELTLKQGAQVMFIRNDPEARYYNGKIAKVILTRKDHIEVQMDNGDLLNVERVEWTNTQYELNKDTNEIQEKNLGSFSQYPLRLAWAITVHKSQGLTFDHMIVDLGDSFTSGQAYVALSRCTSLDGLILLSKMTPRNVMVSDKIVTYHDEAPKDDRLSHILDQAKMKFAGEELKFSFALDDLGHLIDEWRELLEEKKVPDQRKLEATIEQISQDLMALQQVSKSFQGQLHYLVSRYPDNKDLAPIKERVEKAVPYFAENIYRKIAVPIHQHIESLAYKSKVKKYLSKVQDHLSTVINKLDNLYQTSFLGTQLYQGDVLYKKSSLKATVTASTSKKRKKGATYDDTLALFKAGKNIKEIAEIRSMAQSTIEGHIAKWVATGEVSIYNILDKVQVEKISYYLLKDKDQQLTDVKNKLPFEASYNEIRMVKAHLEKMDDL
jgi:uncharacterized coiled-coil protein SlyX